VGLVGGNSHSEDVGRSHSVGLVGGYSQSEDVGGGCSPHGVLVGGCRPLSCENSFVGKLKTKRVLFRPDSWG